MAKIPLAIVTGGAHRLGRTFALSLARQRYAVLVHCHRSAEQAEQTVKEIKAMGVPAFSVQGDLRQIDFIKALFEKVDVLLSNEELGLSHLAVLVNSAAVMHHEDVKVLSEEGWNTVFDLNLRAPFFCAQQASLRMKRKGLIVNVSDVGAEKAWSRFPTYTVSKAGLESLTKVLARSLAPDIRVNAIAPGLVFRSDQVSESEWERLVKRLPLKRVTAPKEITMALELLVKNEYITGQTIVVDGGYSLL